MDIPDSPFSFVTGSDMFWDGSVPLQVTNRSSSLYLPVNHITM